MGQQLGPGSLAGIHTGCLPGTGKDGGLVKCYLKATSHLLSCLSREAVMGQLLIAAQVLMRIRMLS